MIVQFNIHYNTSPGDQLYICGSPTSIGKWDPEKALKLNYSGQGNWSELIKFPKGMNQFEYKYFVIHNDGEQIWELGENRTIIISQYKTERLNINDTWYYPDEKELVLQSSAFRNTIMRTNEKWNGKTSRANQQIVFNIHSARIGSDLQVCLLGNQKSLSNWDNSNPVLLGCNNHENNWTAGINASGLTYPILYKYGLYHTKDNKLVMLEPGENRIIHDPNMENNIPYTHLQMDNYLRYPGDDWKGAGVAVPVFSLRSEASFGVGEFTDLIDFIDWAKSVGMKMVQILPINETIASHNWLDSYPYKSISVMALHPLYLNLYKMGKLKDKNALKEFSLYQKEVNKTAHVNYPEVLRLKSRYYKLLFDQEKATFFKKKEYKDFFKANKEWLIPYAAFVYLRDNMKSPDFRTWNGFKKYNHKKILQISQPSSSEWDDIAIHYFIQFHLDKQLKEVSSYARQNGIVLKGDIPIGISPNSVEAWTEPHFFNLNGQAGAPPDDFAIKGQNWGFPTYNWHEMEKDNFAWWRKRLQKMEEYFDAYRIDHILGFFRIWEIPMDAVEGLLGHFEPAIPLTTDEIQQFGIDFNYERMVKPLITWHYLESLFGMSTTIVIQNYLIEEENGHYKLKDQFNTQRKINESFLDGIEEEELSDHDRHIRDGLFALVANVLFINTGHDEWHPRISLSHTNSFSELDHDIQRKFHQLYDHYYFERHNDFWYKEGMKKLPPVIQSANMLVCGEDLGMVPECVPPVMKQLNILSLEIQRMSKDPTKKFAHPADAPYLSVCTTSTHDMPTIRGWWEDDKDLVQQFYNYELGNHGAAPYFAEPWVCEQMIIQHLYSHAMWVTIPIQDYLAMDGDIRWHETHEEQINEPSNVRHKWRYRMQQSIDELKASKAFNLKLKNLISDSGRNSDF